MATFTVSINAAVNQPPSQTGLYEFTVTQSNVKVFTVANFTTDTNPPYVDPEGDSLFKIQIKYGGLLTGTLQLNGVNVQNNDEILATDIQAGLLTYTASPVFSGTETFGFVPADSGSQSYGPVGYVRALVEEEVNQPPSEVGDGSETIDYGETLVFTPDMFTVDTIPPYSDPEADAAFLLKILSLPVDGTIKLNGANVVANQIIPFTEIAAGNLIYVPDLADTDGDLESFNFAIADSGSGIFVE